MNQQEISDLKKQAIILDDLERNLMNKIIIFLLSLMMFSACKSMNEDNTTISDPQKQQQEQADRRLEYKKGKEEIFRKYLKEKTKNDQRRQKSKRRIEKKKQKENEKNQMELMRFHEIHRTVVREFNEVKKREYKTQLDSITVLMKAHDNFLKTQEIPFNLRKKLITEATIDWIVKEK